MIDVQAGSMAERTRNVVAIGTGMRTVRGKFGKTGIERIEENGTIVRGKGMWVVRPWRVMLSLTTLIVAWPEIVPLALAIALGPDPDLLNIEVTNHTTASVTNPETRGRAIPARHQVLIRKIRMIENEDEERRRRGIRGMERIGKVERKEKLGRKRSARRKRRRRCVEVKGTLIPLVSADGWSWLQKSKKHKTAAVTSQWGTYGIISEAEWVNSLRTASNPYWFVTLTRLSRGNKDPEFRAWLVEERTINPETLQRDKEKKEFLRFVEDFNTGEPKCSQVVGRSS
jgi:hypothetical protein